MALMWGVDRNAASNGEVAALSADSASGSEGGFWTDEKAAVPVSSKDPMWGDRDAPVTVVIYSDFQCPFCGKAEPTLKGLQTKYGPSKLRMIWKNFPLPFHKKAPAAHLAAQTVFELGGNKAFWKFHDLAFQNNRNLDPASFGAWAQQAGVDKAKFEAAFKAGSAQAKVDADIAAGKAVGVRGTPAFYINGVFISGARPQSQFEAEIDKQLAAAKKLIASGTPKNQVYTKLTNTNKAKAPKQPEAKKRPPQDDKTVWKVPVTKNDPIKGNAEGALVTIVEFSDFQCPFCSRVVPTIKKITDTYGDKVRVVWKDNPLPFHNRATPAAMLAREALAEKGNKGFWAAHDLLFANQKALDDASLWGYAEKLGLNVDKVKEAVAQNKYKAIVAADQELASDMNAGGTPHFFVNGRRVKGAQPFEAFKKIIDEEIKKSEALVAKGIAKKDLYAEIIKKGKEPPPPEQKEIGDPPKNAPVKGATNYKVTIHEFSDFQCPFCSRVTPTMKKIMSEYGSELRVVWRHKPLPFHKDAPLAHQAAQEAYAQKGDAAFWAFHDKLFASQKSPGIKRPNLETFAEEAGLDLTKFKAALDGGTHKAFITSEGSRSDKLGIRGTPGFIIQPKGSSKGYLLSGAQPYPKFKKLIERALKEAK